jgi:hypothetical protein
MRLDIIRVKLKDLIAYAEICLVILSFISLQRKLHEIIHALVVNVPTRQLTLDYIADLFEKNRKLSQLQADYEQLGNCTAMLNIFSVLLDLSEKIVIEKIQDNYIFHGNCLLKMQEENGIKMDKALLESYKAEIDISYTPNFNTECFYLTLAFLGIRFLSLYFRIE